MCTLTDYIQFKEELRRKIDDGASFAEIMEGLDPYVAYRVGSAIRHRATAATIHLTAYYQ